MNIRTIAEFVENQQILDVLRTLQVDYAQGYGIARPLPLVQILESMHSELKVQNAAG